MKELFAEKDPLKSSEGFTLLELIIAFAIISMIVLVIAGAMRLAHHSVESGEKKAEYLERTRASMGIISSQIQSQLPISYMEDAEKKYYFQGEKEFLQLATNYSIWGRERGYSVVSYRIESNADGKKVLLASEHTIGIENSRETRLFSGVDTIYFEYFYKDPTDEEGSWIDKWTDEESVPEKIRLNLVIGGKDFTTIIPMRTAAQISPQQTAPGQSVTKPPPQESGPR